MAKLVEAGWLLAACALQLGACRVITDVERDLIPLGGTAGVSGTAGTPGSGGSGTGGTTGGAAGGPECELPTEFRWTSTGPLVGPVSNAEHDLVSIKDPTVVRYEDNWHIYATTATRAPEGGSGNWSLVHLNFSEWSEAGSASQVYLDEIPGLDGYHAAPQLFYFSDQDTWYLIFQSQQPQYSTTNDITDPSSWSEPQNFFRASVEVLFSGLDEEDRPDPWIDYWVICDESHCYLFFTGDNGRFYRSETSRADFPEGMSDPVVALEDARLDLFEGSATYKLKGEDRYLTIIEAIGPTGARYYRSFVADTLDGEWTPLADTWQTPFAGPTNVVSYDDVPSAGGTGGGGGEEAGGAAGNVAATAGGAAGATGAAGNGGVPGAGGAPPGGGGGQAGATSGVGVAGGAGAPANTAGATGRSGAAGAAEVPWTQDISHGELLRDGYDETMTIDACNLQLLYQGRPPGSDDVEYSQLPYRLGLLTLSPAEQAEPVE